MTQVTGLTAELDEENYRSAVEFVSKNLEHTSKAAVGVDMTVMDKQIRGYVFSFSKAHVSNF